MIQIAVKSREPNGRHSRSQNPVDASSPAAVKRLKDAALLRMADEQWGTALGHLLLANAINEQMYAAGRKWADTVADYYRAIGAPPPYPKAISWERYEPSADVDPTSAKGKRLVEKARDAVDDMHDAYGVLRTAGLGAERAVRRVCESDVPPEDWSERVALVLGLAALVRFWRLT